LLRCFLVKEGEEEGVVVAGMEEEQEQREHEREDAWQAGSGA
jgi:hypothetical protein